MANNEGNMSELARLAPAAVIPINTSDYEATVIGTDGNGSIAKVLIKIPSELEGNPLLILYTGYLQSPAFLKLMPSTRYTKAITIRNFFDYVQNENDFLKSGLPFDVVNQFFICQKINSEKTSFYNDELNLKVPINCILKRNNDIDKKYFDSTLANYLAFFPKFPPPKSKPKKALSELFGQKNCPFSDTELLQSLRLGCCFLLNQFSNIREKLLKECKISDALDKLKNEEYKGLPILTNLQTTNYTIDSALSKKTSEFACAKFKDINTDVLETVLELADPCILEWFLLNSFPSPKEGSPEAALPKAEWVKLFYKDGKFSSQVTLEKNAYRLQRIGNITPKYLLSFLDIETFLIQCLLASESIQRGGLQSHSLKDFSITSESTQIGYNKGRRKKSSATPIYTRQSLPHQCYTRYVNQREEAAYNNYSASQKTLHYDIKGTSKGHIGFTSKSLNFFELLIGHNSEIKKLYMKELEEEGDAFLWLIKKIWKHNRLAYFETIKNNTKRNRSEPKKGDSKRINRVIGLTPDAISMSRKRADDGESIHEKIEYDTTDNSGTNDQHVSAELTAHSNATKHNTYKNRSYSKEAIESERDFGAQVGNLMVEEALKLGSELKSVKYLKLEQVRDLLGITNEIEKTEKLLEQVDTELWGGFQHNGDTIITTNETTAMLLKGYINHIILELPKLFLDDQSKGQEAQKKLAYLSSIFDQFPAYMQKQGEEMLDKYDIPYPSLL
jgi:hypothetical protein